MRSLPRERFAYKCLPEPASRNDPAAGDPSGIRVPLGIPLFLEQNLEQDENKEILIYETRARA